MSPILLLILIGQAVIVLAPCLVPGRVLSTWPMPLRILLGLVVLLFGGFYAFGFLATFEPLDPATQWGFRIFYVLAALAAIIGAIRLFRPRTASASL